MADPIVYEIDPDYDTVIVLRDPCKEFAPSDPEQESGGESETSSEISESTSDVERAEGDADSTESEDEEVIQYRVSSHRLILASPWFKRTLTSSGAQEAVPDPADGLHYINAHDWDEEAFLILLNAVHLRQVPSTVDLETLAKIAVLVDYYELQRAEAIEDHVESWIKGLWELGFRSVRGRNGTLRLCIASILESPENLKATTWKFLSACTGPVPTLGLPILRVISQIELKRVEIIGRVISMLHGLLDKYRHPHYYCQSSDYDVVCAEHISGILVKEMKRCGVLSPPPTSPFVGISIGKMIDMLRRMRSSSSWYHDELEEDSGEDDVDSDDLDLDADSEDYRIKHPCPAAVFHPELKGIERYARRRGGFY